MSYTTQRSLTEEEKSELEQLSANVAAAIVARRDWLDAKMHETSRLKVGDEIFDVKNGRILGKVSKLYRYWRDRNDLLDTSYYCDYSYETSPHSFDNTSRQSGLNFGTREDAIKNAERRMAYLQQQID